MSEYFNDSPIENADDDQYGIAPFAKAIATSIATINNPVGTTIAINGPWGAGKSSAVNLIRNELRALDSVPLSIIDFKCWWYRGEEALTLAFLQELHKALQLSLGDKVKRLIPKIGQHILQAGPVIGTAASLAATGGWSGLIPGSTDFLKRFFPEGDSLEKTFKDLAKALSGQNQRFLVIIDDIDRLSPEESIAIFRLVKSVGRLPNIVYMLVFDRQLADATVAQRYPSEGPHFLEKIIQAGFEIPSPSQTDLNNAVLALAQNICGAPPDDQIVRFMNIFYDVVAPYIKTPRHVTRLTNAVSVTWPAVANEVNRGDYLGLETLRLYEPQLYNNIRANREIIVGNAGASYNDDRPTDKFALFLGTIDSSEHERLKIALQRLFPVFENTRYMDGFVAIWDAERRLCISKHFDTYFRLALSDEALSAADLAEILERANEHAFVVEKFRNALSQVRKNGRSMVPILLDELTSHAARMDKAKVEPFLCTLFEIADEIRRDVDKEPGFPSADAHLRMHWLIRRLTENRYDIDERSALYLKATETASLRWVADFTSSAIADYKERDSGPQSPEKCLTTEEALPTLRQRGLKLIESAAENGSIWHTDDPMYLLYRWRNISEDGGAKLRVWLAEQMQQDSVLITMAKHMTGEAWTTGLGMFGLGDRVSKRQVRAQISEHSKMFDVPSFKSALERIATDAATAEDDRKTVTTFLNAWNAQIAEDD
jgi:predicted KAP-like P-loop ATPase/cation transport regulator ChaB